MLYNYSYNTYSILFLRFSKYITKEALKRDSNMNINLIVCADKNFGIGKNNTLPWNYSKDLEFFKNSTISNNSKKINIVIMGNNTYKSIPEKRRPLKHRLNIVLTKNKELYNYDKDLNILDTKLVYFNDLISILYYLDNNKKYINDVWVCGGSYIYTQFLELHIVNNIYLTSIINSNFNCDTFFPSKYLKYFEPIDRTIESDYNKNSYSIIKDKLQFTSYSYKNKDELKYLTTICKILNKGISKMDRTKVGTISTFGKSFTYNIRNYRLPLFTHRKMFYRGIIEELLFFISGKTDTKLLESKNVNIWKGNTSREFLDSRNLNHLNEGDMGAGYSFQLRHFGADYINAETDYSNQGFDQLKYVIDLIKRDPHSRRILFSYWNPTDLDKVALPSCFLKDSLVLTKNGYIPIQKLNLDNDKVYTHEGEWQKIKSVYSYKYSGLIYYISCQYNTKYIKTTPEHPFYVIEKQNIGLLPYWCKAEDLHKDHLFCLPINKTEKLIKLNYDDEFSNYLLSTHNREITYEDCYFFGYFLKTGTYDSNNNYYISISDSDLINLHNYFDYFETISEHKNLNNNTYTKFKITDYKYYNYLHKFGNKKFNKFIPEWVVNLPPKYLTYFLKGFNYKNQNRFIVYSKQLAYTLQRIFAKMHLYLSITFLSKNRNSFSLKIIKNSKFIDNDFQYFPIKSIMSKTKQTDVYNLEVENDNSYIVQNVAVHNCHILYQFYINKDTNELSCSFYQRSSDFVLAANFNIVSAAVLTFMLCHITGYKPGKIIHTIGDVHIYQNHIEETKKMLNNFPYNFPIFHINDPDNKIKNIEDFKYDDFKILLYKSYDKYNFKMAV
jgi:thymidylate synthase/dihydrofolate reductase